MTTTRVSGILLHPTSLPGPFGVGDLGPACERFLDALAAAKQAVWQILPLGPTGYGDSPYSPLSSFAGNPLLLSPERLVEAKLLTDEEVAAASAELSEGPVDFAAVRTFKEPLFRLAADRFLHSLKRGKRRAAALDRFRAENANWLPDFALFTAVKAFMDVEADHEGADNACWNHYWPADIAKRTSKAVARWREELAGTIERVEVLQFLFFEQWAAVREYARRLGIRIIGDLPIFVAADSADVWASPQFFLLDKDRRQTVVAGVPPDVFSATGQRWGNPLYNWRSLARDKYQWWVERVAAVLKTVDAVRLDHFRGLCASWASPADQDTAEHGEWLPVPGGKLLAAVREELGRVPIIAEDLGIITPDVEALRDEFALPGMKVLQFAFELNEEGEPDEQYLPHRHPANSVVYTGTHDNEPSEGWYRRLSTASKAFLDHYVGHAVNDPSWEMVRLAMASPADTAVVPLQDVLGLGDEARMNFPGRAAGNWTWRAPADYVRLDWVAQLRQWARVYDRLPAVE